MPKRKNLVGHIYGELQVVEMLYNYNGNKRTYCRCVDIDGDETVVRQDALQSGATKTAIGSKNKGIEKNLIGMKFGKITIDYKTNKRDTNGAIIWSGICECGNRCEYSSSELIRGRHTSCGCDKYKSMIRDLSNMRFGHLVAIEPCGYNDKHTKRLWRCKCDCGNETVVTTSDLTAGNTMSCGCSNFSHGEIRIKAYLDDNKISYISQKRFDDCRDILPLPFDFYLPNYNTCIEYQGEQHYRPIEHFGGDDAFIIRKMHDKIKLEYCQQHKINLIVIPYNKIIEEELNNFFDNLKSPVTITA